MGVCFSVRKDHDQFQKLATFLGVQDDEPQKATDGLYSQMGRDDIDTDDKEDFEEMIGNMKSFGQAIVDKLKAKLDKGPPPPKYSPKDHGWSVCPLEAAKEAVASMKETGKPRGLREQRYADQVRAAAFDGNDATFEFVPQPNGPPLKVAVIGDFGTGDEHQTAALTAAKEQGVDIICHLGDIYYCGTDDQCKTFWQGYEQVFPGPASRPALFCIPGNHEYICGGRGFYNTLLNGNKLGDAKNNRFQHTSFFCIRIPGKVQIIGLDTGLRTRYREIGFHAAHSLGIPEDPSKTEISDRELEWLKRKLSECKDPTILLSHHQPRSPHWRVPNARSPLWNQLSSVLDAAANPQVGLWLWGHEHKYMVFNHDYVTDDKHIIGRCMGNGAMPEPYKKGSAYWEEKTSFSQPTKLGSNGEWNNCVAAIVSTSDIPEMPRSAAPVAPAVLHVAYHRVLWDAGSKHPNNDPVIAQDWICVRTDGKPGYAPVTVVN